MILSLEGVSCAYNGTDVLSDVTLRIEPADVVGVVGPNGSGKSTLIRAMSRVLRPRLGQALLDGRNLYTEIPARESARSVAVVPQESSTAFDFTCEEIVSMGRAPHIDRFRSESPRDAEIVRQVMERTETWGLRSRLFHTLSGGERQRVILARAFAQEPAILLLDEPTSHLDLGHQIQIMKLTRELGCAVLATLHDLNLAAAYCSRLLLLDRGTIVAAGTPEEVLRADLLESVYRTPIRVERRMKGLVVLPQMP